MMATVVLASCSKEKEKEPVITVQAANAQRGTIAEVIHADAIVFPRDEAAITPKITAPVLKFFVNRGSRVRQGEVLAILENRDLAAAVEENKGNLEQAEASYKTAMAANIPEELQKAELDVKSSREALDAAQKVFDSRQQLYNQGALPRRDLDQANVALVQARAQFDIASKHLAALQTVGNAQAKKSATGQLASARGKYQGANAQLSYSEIRSPLNGVVTDRPLFAGETAAAGTPLITVMDMSSVTARGHIPQEQAALLRVGDPATITAPGGAAVNGKVKLISPALDPNSTTVEVWVEAANKDGRLRPGATVTVDMTAQTVSDAVIVPVAAVLKNTEGETTVMTVGSDGRAHEVQVETGILQGDRLQIAKGLTGSEKVITSGAYGLPDKTRVKVEEATAAQTSTGTSDASKRQQKAEDKD